MDIPQQKHSSLKLIWSPYYEVSIGEHVFPTQKYRLIRERLIREGSVGAENFVVPVPATHEQLLTVHTAEYLDDLEALRRTERTIYSELPLTDEIVNAYKLAAGGTILACRDALGLVPAVCCHIGGGFHHAFGNHAEGFCYINDVAVGIRVMQAEGHIKRATVIDLDLHQGNGTAHIFEQDPSVFTVSLHQENNYPHKENSTIDVGLEDFTDDTEYLAHLEPVFGPALDEHKPDLVVFVAGADPYQDDVLGRLKLTMHGLRERDYMVLDACMKRKIPVVTVTAGGYARHVSDTVAVHSQTCSIAAELVEKYKKAKA